MNTYNTTRSRLPFWSAHGFSSNPFEYTNADQEDKLPEYFISPPYFTSVVGDPTKPIPAVVFAPRGAGKSAQRIMTSRELPESVLIINYTDFPIQSNSQYDLNYHLENIIQHALIGLITVQGTSKTSLSNTSYDMLRKLSSLYLADVDELRLGSLLRSLRSLSQRHRGFWRDWGGHVGTLAGYALATVLGNPAPPPLVFDSSRDTFQPDRRADFYSIGQLATEIGVHAVYILIDRIDELPHTQNDWASTYEFVATMLNNLDVIEKYPFAFRFFLPSELETMWLDQGGREDRIRTFRTVWTNEELSNMVQSRLRAFTDDEEVGMDMLTGSAYWTSTVLTFAAGSPRDIIRILNQCVVEATRSEPSATGILDEMKGRAIDEFCRQRAHEIAGRSNLETLQQINLADFAVADAADGLEVNRTTARGYVKSMEQRGLVFRVPARGRPGRTGRPEQWFAVHDVRVARSMFPELSVREFFESKIRQCVKGHSNCSTPLR